MARVVVYRKFDQDGDTSDPDGCVPKRSQRSWQRVGSQRTRLLRADYFEALLESDIQDHTACCFDSFQILQHAVFSALGSSSCVDGMAMLVVRSGIRTSRRCRYRSCRQRPDLEEIVRRSSPEDKGAGGSIRQRAELKS